MVEAQDKQKWTFLLKLQLHDQDPSRAASYTKRKSDI
jgi:hypothetical protein